MRIDFSQQKEMTVTGKSEIERLTVLETNYSHVLEKLDTQNTRIEALQTDLSEIKNLLQQAKGARWALIAVATLGGGTGGAFLSKFLSIPFFK